MDAKKELQSKDILILEMFQTDPQAAFRLMFDTYYMPLCLYAVQITDSFQTSEDIVQNLFITFWEKKHYKNIILNLRNYLFYSVRNNAYLNLKKNKFISLEELSQTEIDESDCFCDEKELQEREKIIMEELEKLPQKELEVIKAIVLENKKYKEVAEELGISVNTVKTHLARAMKRLRKTKHLKFFIFV